MCVKIPSEWPSQNHDFRLWKHHSCRPLGTHRRQFWCTISKARVAPNKILLECLHLPWSRLNALASNVHSDLNGEKKKMIMMSFFIIIMNVINLWNRLDPMVPVPLGRLHSWLGYIPTCYCWCFCIQQILDQTLTLALACIAPRNLWVSFNLFYALWVN